MRQPHMLSAVALGSSGFTETVRFRHAMSLPRAAVQDVGRLEVDDRVDGHWEFGQSPAVAGREDLPLLEQPDRSLRYRRILTLNCDDAGQDLARP